MSTLSRPRWDQLLLLTTSRSSFGGRGVGITQSPHPPPPHRSLSLARSLCSRVETSTDISWSRSMLEKAPPPPPHRLPQPQWTAAADHNIIIPFFCFVFEGGRCEGRGGWWNVIYKNLQSLYTSWRLWLINKYRYNNFIGKRFVNVVTKSAIFDTEILFSSSFQFVYNLSKMIHSINMKKRNNYRKKLKKELKKEIKNLTSIVWM